MTGKPFWDAGIFNLSLPTSKANNNANPLQQDGHNLYDERSRSTPPCCENVNKRLGKETTPSIKILEMSADTSSNRSLSWTGLLSKQIRGPLGSWKPRWFQLGPPPQADNNKLSAPHSRYAVLIYQSEGKHWKHLYVHDVRLERHLDSGLRVAFSIGISPANDLMKETSPEQAQRRCAQERILLMASTDLDAVAFLSCLRRILDPERAWPTLRDAIHYPGEALRGLAGNLNAGE